MAELIRGEVLRRAASPENIRKALKSKGFTEGPFVYRPPERPGQRDLGSLKDLLRKAEVDELTASAEYSGLALMAERLGQTETARKLYKIASDESEHNKILGEILSRGP